MGCKITHSNGGLSSYLLNVRTEFYTSIGITVRNLFGREHIKTTNSVEAIELLIDYLGQTKRRYRDINGTMKPLKEALNLGNIDNLDRTNLIGYISKLDDHVIKEFKDSLETILTLAENIPTEGHIHEPSEDTRA
jgi:hypothetical protein